MGVKYDARTAPPRCRPPLPSKSGEMSVPRDKVATSTVEAVNSDISDASTEECHNQGGDEVLQNEVDIRWFFISSLVVVTVNDMRNSNFKFKKLNCV